MNAPAPIRAIVVDDEPPARARIRWLLRAEPDVIVVAECEDAVAAAADIARERPDLLFLDIRLPGADGVSLLEGLGEAAPPHVIFVTAYDDYAVRAFDLHAADYLLKPFDPDRFHDALERVRRARAAQAPAGEDAGGAQAPASAHAGSTQAPGHARVPEPVDPRMPPAGPRRFLDRIAVRTGGRVLLVPVDELEWVEAEGNYARLHLGEASYLVRETMAALEDALDPERFARIHRSTIVNLERIRELHPLFHGEYVVVLRSGARLTLSRGYRARLHRRWGRAL